MDSLKKVAKINMLTKARTYPILSLELVDRSDTGISEPTVLLIKGAAKNAQPQDATDISSRTKPFINPHTKPSARIPSANQSTEVRGSRNRSVK